MVSKVCPQQGTCELHKSIGMSAALRVWQSFYCEGCFSRCERFKLGASGLPVPARLLPNGRLLEGAAGPPATSRHEQAA